MFCFFPSEHEASKPGSSHLTDKVSASELHAQPQRGCLGKYGTAGGDAVQWATAGDAVQWQGIA